MTDFELLESVRMCILDSTLFRKCLLFGCNMRCRHIARGNDRLRRIVIGMNGSDCHVSIFLMILLNTLGR